MKSWYILQSHTYLQVMIILFISQLVHNSILGLQISNVQSWVQYISKIERDVSELIQNKYYKGLWRPSKFWLVSMFALFSWVYNRLLHSLYRLNSICKLLVNSCLLEKKFDSGALPILKVGIPLSVILGTKPNISKQMLYKIFL